MNTKDVLEHRIIAAKKELEQRKQFFLLSVQNEIDNAAFERNAIAKLVAMQECKIYIKTLTDTIDTMNIEI